MFINNHLSRERLLAGSSLLTLLDDIATVLDDVAILSKVAAKKTAGVLGDDLALNAEQVSGVKADRELPVVWAVAKGSFLNKLIIVPAALAISAFAPPLITVLLVIGGLFLCFEGFEKVFHKYFHKYFHKSEELQQDKQVLHQKKLAALADDNVDLVAFEQAKIKGAIRTDFILSAEIVVIALGTVQEAAFGIQVAVVSGLALAITFGVYGLVAGIVKLDDLGLYLLRKSVSGRFNTIQRALGRGLLIFAPALMKTLTVVGTIAMFLVGGGILVHSFEWLHKQVHHFVELLAHSLGSIAEVVVPILTEGIVGIIAGGLILLTITVAKSFKKTNIT
ncbi:MAG: putative DNA repair protein MutK [Colwellia sp.]|jgi:predicted DNA repair protein MutK